MANANQNQQQNASSNSAKDETLTPEQIREMQERINRSQKTLNQSEAAHKATNEAEAATTKAAANPTPENTAEARAKILTAKFLLADFMNEEQKKAYLDDLQAFMENTLQETKDEGFISRWTRKFNTLVMTYPKTAVCLGLVVGGVIAYWLKPTQQSFAMIGTKGGVPQYAE